MADDKTQETWTYAGVRVGKGGKKLHAWSDGSADLLYFGKLVGHAVGGRYAVQVARADDGTFESVAISTAYTGERSDNPDLVAGWQTEHRLAEISMARERAERKVRDEPDALDEAIQPLRDLRARSCRTRADRVAFTALVIELLGQ